MWKLENSETICLIKHLKQGFFYDMKVKVSRSVVSDSLLYIPWNSPGENTGVGSLSPLQGIFPTQGSNPGLLHCRWILYHLSHWGTPRILEWVAYPLSSRSSRPRNQTGVSCIAGRFFTNWAMREAWTMTRCSGKIDKEQLVRSKRTGERRR